MVRITSGEHKGLYVGRRIMGDWQRTPGIMKEIIVALGPQEILILDKDSGARFIEGEASRLGARKVQADLKALGYQSELVEVK